MPEKQMFSNNARNQLALAVLAADTSIELNDSSGFSAPGTGQYELATITNADGSVVEIVKITANAANVLTVVRAQENTTARNWPVGSTIDGRITAGTMARLAQGVDNGGDPLGADAINIQPGRDSADQVASGLQAIAIGRSSKATHEGAMAIGPFSTANNFFTGAFGAYATAYGQGANALGNGSIARADAANALAGTDNDIAYSVMVGAFPVVRRCNNDYEGEQFTQAPGTFLFSPYFDIGDVQAWQATTNYPHGSIVRPTTPNGYQYGLVSFRDVASSTQLTTLTSNATEPTWLTGNLAETYDGAGDAWTWMAYDISQYLMQAPPVGTLFIPLEFGFLSNDVIGVMTSSPIIKIGIGTNNTLFAASENVLIDASNQCHRVANASNFVLTENDQMSFGLVTAGVGASCVGRFYVHGVFVELPDHA